MRRYFLLSILPLILFYACSMEDPETEEPKSEEPPPKEVKDTEPPSVPQELNITAKTFESLSLTWKASTDNDKVDKYLIYQDATKVAEVRETAITLSGLSPGNLYSMSVAAVDASGNTSGKSPVLEAATEEDLEAPGIPQGLNLSELTRTSVSFSWESASDNAGIRDYDIFLNGEFFATTTATEFTITDLQEGTRYFITLISRDIYDNISAESAALEFMTEAAEETPPETSSGVLFLSEYLEGSSYNKALEIANLTGAVVDLRSYSLKKISNENTAWGDEKKLEGSLTHGETFVLAHSKSVPAILEQADLQMGGGIMDFNGNDVIGLFKDGELVDIIGTPGGEDFAKDVTLRRKTSAALAKSTYDPQDWEVLEMDLADGLGKY